MSLYDQQDTRSPEQRGDSQRTAMIVGALLWFCATLAIGAVIAGAASGETTVAPSEVDWHSFTQTVLAWVLVLNVPVWGLAAFRWRQRR